VLLRQIKFSEISSVACECFRHKTENKTGVAPDHMFIQLNYNYIIENCIFYQNKKARGMVVQKATLRGANSMKAIYLKRNGKVTL